MKNEFVQQTIQTHFLGPTNRLGARIVAQTSGSKTKFVMAASTAERIFFERTGKESPTYSERDEIVAMALAYNMGWIENVYDPNAFFCGSTPSGYVFILA